MAENNTFDGALHIRVKQSELDIFIQKAERVTGKPYHVLVREMITAFNDDNLRIKPTEEHHVGKLYSKF